MYLCGCCCPKRTVGLISSHQSAISSALCNITREFTSSLCMMKNPHSSFLPFLPCPSSPPPSPHLSSASQALWHLHLCFLRPQEDREKQECWRFFLLSSPLLSLSVGSHLTPLSATCSHCPCMCVCVFVFTWLWCTALRLSLCEKWQQHKE